MSKENHVYKIVVVDETGKEYFNGDVDRFMLVASEGETISKTFSSEDLIEKLGMLEFTKLWITNEENIGKKQTVRQEFHLAPKLPKKG